MRTLLLLVLALPACAKVADLHTPIHSPVRVLDVPPPPRTLSANSTYGARSTLFADRIAHRPGDVLTVQIRIDDKASLSNTSNRSRTVGRNFSADGAGKISHIVKALRGSAGVSSDTDFAGRGGTKRSESIRLAIAATVRDVLPSGNLLIEGRQEVRVNAEMRVLEVSGIVRPGRSRHRQRGALRAAGGGPHLLRRARPGRRDAAPALGPAAVRQGVAVLMGGLVPTLASFAIVTALGAGIGYGASLFLGAPEIVDEAGGGESCPRRRRTANVHLADLPPILTNL